MIGLLAIIGIALILYFVSKAFKNIGNFLMSMSYAVYDIIDANKHCPHNNKIPVRHDKIVERHLQNKKGENDAYTHRVREEIEEIIQGLDD
jgi:hypothetical protein